MTEENNVQEWKSILVDRVKSLQRSSHEVKLEWYAYCKKSGCAHFDPNRYDPDFLLQFLGKFKPGQHGGGGPSFGSSQAPAAEPPPSVVGMMPPPQESASAKKAAGHGGKWAVIEKVKDIQRSSPDNRKCWYAFCQSQCTSNYDPARHDEVFLRKFIEVFEAGKLGGTPANNSASSASSGWWGGESSEWDGGGSDWSSWGGKGPAAGWGGFDAGGDGSSSSAPQMVAPAAFLGMMKGKTAMMKGMDPQEAAALGKGVFAAMMEKGAAMGKGPGAGPALAGAAYGAVMPGGPSAALNNKLVSSSTRNLSEFGILDVPLDEARLNAKRGFASISMEPGPGAGGLMTEEQAKQFQKSLRRG